jgi:hypothetical protein
MKLRVRHPLLKFKYPKLLLLGLSIILSYWLFKYPGVFEFFSGLGGLSYLGVFIAGMLFAFGFSAAFAVGFFLALSPSNIWLAALVGGLGALLSDILIFRFIRLSFQEEFKRVKKITIARRFEDLIERSLGKKIKIYLMYVFAGFLIASPLPDEAGVIMLSGLTKVKERFVALISFVLNTIGIFIILSI